jgi:hypothetical protein
MSKTTQDMDEMRKEYDDAKSKEDALTPIYLNQESEAFAKKWIANGLPIYDKSGNLIVINNDDDKKKAPKKKL